MCEIRISSISIYLSIYLSLYIDIEIDWETGSLGELESLCELEIAQYRPYNVTVLYTQNGRRLPGLFILNKTHKAVESRSHVHRSSVN